MKKTNKKIISILLSCLMMSALALSACGKENTSNVANNESSFNGTHVYTVEETSKPFIVNGQTDYAILIPENSSSYLYTASEELAYFFEKATDIRLPSVVEKDTTLFSDQKFISIGETDLLKATDITVEKDKLGADGHIIRTDESGNIYLVGGSDYGSMYAVYTFLQVTFNFESYFVDCYEIDTGVKNKNLLNYQVTDIPDFGHRGQGYGVYTDNAMSYDTINFKHRMRMSKGRGSNLMPIHREYDIASGSATSTNADWILPFDIYGAEHPEWFSTRSTAGSLHFCFNANGNFEPTVDEEGNTIPSEYDQMVQEVAQKIIFSLMNYTPDRYPQYTAISVTTQDNHNVCQCTTCLEEVGKYGSYGGVAAEFINDVGALVDSWMNEPENSAYKREDFRIIFFAYMEYLKPPVTKAEGASEFTPIDNLTLRDNVGVYLALSNYACYNVPLNHPANDSAREFVLDGWSSLTDCIWLWTYSTNFSGYTYICPTFEFYNDEGYTHLAKQGVRQIIVQGQTGNPWSTAWEALKCYLDSKLQWNCSLNTQDLMRDYFNAMYGDAADLMMTEFYRQVGYTKQMYEKNDWLYTESKTNSRAVGKTQYWPLAVMESWTNAFDEAKKTLNPSDPNYEKYINHIHLEEISPVWITLKLYGDNLLSTERQAVLEQKLYDMVVGIGCSNMMLGEKLSAGTILDVLK